MAEKKKATPKSYKVLVGINYTPVGEKEEVRSEPGDEVSGDWFEPSDIAQLVAQGTLEEVE